MADINAEQYIEDVKDLRTRDREQGESIADLRERVQALETAHRERQRVKDNRVNWQKWAVPTIITIGNLVMVILTYTHK